MKILVAGATGAVGRILLPKLVSAGHEVTGLTHADSRKQAIATMGARAEAVDVFDRSGMMDVFADVRPEIVIHQLTALHDRDFAANARIRVEGTRNLVDAAVSAGVQRVIAQSIAWAYEPGDTPASEETPLDIHATIARKRLVNSVRMLEHCFGDISMRRASVWDILWFGNVVQSWWMGGRISAPQGNICDAGCDFVYTC